MTKCQNVGQIFEKADEQLFEWIIPISWLTKTEDGICLTSPHFTLPDSVWYLTLYPNGYARYQSEGWIGLFLQREDNGSPKSITYTLQISFRRDSRIFTKTRIFERGGCSSGEPRLLKKTETVSLAYEMFNTVKITCQINNYSFISLQGTPDSVSCAIQTKIPDSVTNKEISKHEDESSLDMKEVTILRDHMKELLIKGRDHDVTISVKDKEFRAHRSILSARSPVFAMMFTHETKEKNTGTINIEDCDPDTFEDFLLYVYAGRTENLTPSKALQLYYTADKYDFPVLKERCVNLLKTSLSVSSICDVVLLAAKHQEKDLLEMVTEFFAGNMEEILVSVSWQNFMAQNSVEANEMLIKSMKMLLPRK